MAEFMFTSVNREAQELEVKTMAPLEAVEPLDLPQTPTRPSGPSYTLLTLTGLLIGLLAAVALERGERAKVGSGSRA